MGRLDDIHSQVVIRIPKGVAREEYLGYMTFAANERPLFTEIFGPIIGLKEEWAAQGATPAELDFTAFRYRAPRLTGLSVNTGWLGYTPEEILEETDEHIIARDGRGRLVKLCKGYATLPLPLEYQVKTMGDWLRIKPRYLFSEKRFDRDWLDAARRAQARGEVVSVSIPGAFSEPRELMGDAEVCLAYAERSEVIYDMLQTFSDTAFAVLERVSSQLQVDQLSVHEDMAGKDGPLVGPGIIQEFFRPYFRRIWDMLAERGARLFFMDSDGNIGPIISALLEAGLNVLSPMEPTAGTDIVKLREVYGRRLAFWGGIDKHVLRRSKEEIVAELEYKIPPMVKTGGCVFGLDHRIPNGTPLESYRFYIARAWEIMERETATL